MQDQPAGVSVAVNDTLCPGFGAFGNAATTTVDAVFATATVIGFRRFLARQPRPFGASLEELQADRECIRAKVRR